MKVHVTYDLIRPWNHEGRIDPDVQTMRISFMPEAERGERLLGWSLNY